MKIKGIATNAKEITEEQKEEAHYYVKRMKEIGKQIKQDAKYKVNGILIKVSV